MMKKLITVLISVIAFNMAAFASVSDPAKDLKSLSASLWKAPMSSTTVSQKHDLAIVYGGADISRKVTAADLRSA
jgi:hypothetical protein